jgi:ribbon-helix-helix CopG family protein
MATRTVRLDDETEKILDQLVRVTGLSISAVLKRGLLAFRERLGEPAERFAYDVYDELDLGPGGYSIAPSTESRRGVQEALRRKLGR